MNHSHYGGRKNSPASLSLDMSLLNEGLYESPDKKIIRKELIDEFAFKAGRHFARNEKITSTQLRKFFNDFRSLEAKIQADKENFVVYTPYIRLLKSKAAYAKGRGNVTESFFDFISKLVNLVKDYKDFKTIVTVFEAVVGYYYGEGGGKSR